jgi:hypothetical protein
MPFLSVAEARRLPADPESSTAGPIADAVVEKSGRARPSDVEDESA